MRQKSFTRRLGRPGSLLGLVLFLALPAIAQNKPAKRDDREMDRVQAMITQAKKEAEEFSKSGGNTDDPKHPLSFSTLGSPHRSLTTLRSTVIHSLLPASKGR